MRQINDITTAAKVNDAVKRCKALAQELGGNVKLIDHLLICDKLVTSRCPFSNHLGVNWNEKIVYVSNMADISDIGGMIHEMGHVFASNKPPDRSEEFMFFGWEYAAAKSIGLLKLWSKGTNNYVVGSDSLPPGHYVTTQWGDLNSFDKSFVIKDRLKLAIKNKMVAKDLYPLTIRIE